MKRDARGRYLASPALQLSRQLKQIALLRSHPEMVQRTVDDEWRWCSWLFGRESEAA